MIKSDFMGNATDQFVTDFIEKTDLYYLKDTEQRVSLKELRNPLRLEDVFFLKMKSITFEDKAPRKEALENVLSSMRFPNINFIYLIKGSRDRITFYYGIARDITSISNNSVDILSIGDSVLRRSIESNFRGSIVCTTEDSEKQQIISDLHNYRYVNVLEGVPGQNIDDAAEFQSVDRLIDVMLGDEFMFLITSKALHLDAITSIENNIFDFYQKLVPASKKNLQNGNSEGISSTKTDTKGTTKGNNYSCQQGNSTTHTIGSNEGASHESKSFTKTSSDSSSDNNSETKGGSSSESESISNANGLNKNKNESISVEIVNKKVQDWMKYIDESILKRIDYGKGKGLFISSIVLLANSELVLNKLANTSTALFSGATGNKVPLRLDNYNSRRFRLDYHRNLQLPIGFFTEKLVQNEVSTRAALSQYSTSSSIYFGNWYSANELGIIAGLPQKEVVGLSLNEEVEFGLNYSATEKINDRIPIGNLVQSGNIHKEIEISLDKKELSKHIFVCGVTGSGKTTTCMSILTQSNLPFLVIEPAKTEYRVLANSNRDILVFTLGRDDIAPFRLNPLEFFPTETISSHIDMVKASIEASFDMEAAIPQIIEASLYQCYEKCGWDIHSNTNKFYTDPFADGVYAFPTLSDLITMTEKVVKDQGFDERLKNDYLGSIRARLMGLVIGAKGEMLNTKRSIDFRDLINRKVIIELDNIRSGTEKSLIMGFILSNLNEALKSTYKKNPSFKHITLVEEAHRLLSKYMPGDSLNKKNGVETFADMLAEIRKYGESLIIADQIPDKMTPDVLKNTNTKIVHKIFAQDDKEAIGNTMSLSQEQKSFLSHLVTGRAIVFSQGWEKSIQVQIKQICDTTKSSIKEEELRLLVLRYYGKNYRKGIFPELACFEKEPDINQTEACLFNLKDFRELVTSYTAFISNVRNKYQHWLSSVNYMSSQYTSKELSSYLNKIVYRQPDEESERMLFSLIESTKHNSIIIDSVFIEKYNLIINQKSKN